ncbi:MAG: tetratricopeptide repeat protein, partial [Lachnospiraceae bacterium]|nr:tetratricopeptide repeat protein [Lachnospiraceae bacterium]
MGPEVMNKNRNSAFHGPYAGRDMYIVMLEDKEREFVVTHNANIRPVSYFTGRETELEELRQRIEERRKSVLVSGMGGIGKTHICRKLFEEYLMKHADDENIPFQHIGYIEYSGDMGSSLQNCLRYKEQSDQKLNQEAAWRELEYLASDGKLLLFVDNVNKSMVEDLGLQRLNSIPGAVVLTSRQTLLSDEFEPYRIGFLEIDQCREIYEKIRFENSGRKVMSEYVQDLDFIIDKLAGRHTITVEFLAHLAWTKRWTEKRLRDELEQKGFRLEFHKNSELINIQRFYEVLYDLSSLTVAEQNILEAFSVFPYIPLSAEICNRWLLADAGVCEEDDILTGLYQKGWLQFDIQQESYAMHPVFAQFVYHKCRPNVEMHSGLVRACEDCLKISDRKSVLECKEFIPFAENIVGKLSMEKYTENLEYIKILGYLFYCLGEYKKAKKLYENFLKIFKKELAENPLDTAIIFNNLAVVYERQGEYEKAEELYEKSLNIRERVHGEDHPDTATCYNNLAVVYKRRGEYEKAEELYKKSLNIRERVHGEDHPDTATCYNNLAGVYERQGEYEKAEELYKKSLNIRERMLG